MKIKIKRHLEEHFFSYCFVLVLFAVGVGFGAWGVANLPFSQKQDLLTFLQQFFHNSVIPNGSSVFLPTLLMNIRLALVVWLLGVIIFGLPIIIILVFFQGFVLGFSVAFLIEQMGGKGLLLALCSVLPHNLLLVPASLALAALGVHFTFQSLGSLRQRRPFSFRQHLLRHSSIALPLLLVVAAASVVESWFSPFLVRLIARYF